MRAKLLYLTPLLAAGLAVSVGPTAIAAAVPVCTNTTPTTTQCERPGNTQIHASPALTGNNYPFGWPWWGWGSGIFVNLGRH